MNRQQQPETQPQATQEATGDQVLDQVIQTTERQKSLTEAASKLLGVPKTKMCELLRNVWGTSKGQPPLTDQEMFAGISLIARFELDPITREVYVTRDNRGRLLTIVGIDGWIKILDRTDHYDGHEVELEMDKKTGLPIWAETRIYSTKRSRPAVYRAFWSEYQTAGGFVSKQMPSHMLRIFSLRHAARLFVPLGASVVTPEEAERMMEAVADDVVNAASSAKPKTLDDLADRQEDDGAEDGSATRPNSTEVDRFVSEEDEDSAANLSGSLLSEAEQQFERCEHGTEVEKVYDKLCGPDSDIDEGLAGKIEVMRAKAHKRLSSAAEREEKEWSKRIDALTGTARQMVDQVSSATEDQLDRYRSGATFLPKEQQETVLESIERRKRSLVDAGNTSV